MHQFPAPEQTSCATHCANWQIVPICRIYNQTQVKTFFHDSRGQNLYPRVYFPAQPVCVCVQFPPPLKKTHTHKTKKRKSFQLSSKTSQPSSGRANCRSQQNLKDNVCSFTIQRAQRERKQPFLLLQTTKLTHVCCTVHPEKARTKVGEMSVSTDGAGCVG